ncbi:hypothetical protein AVEN_17192-1 [Araneus ventricosus]|uniref:Uncharacterized protein n=1 Tax=Araneus ventricosus TaxID=182803 RepID=A0A4Y2DUY6_ARAVE|nr:hypothetical protein AVEN_17192-1 [Araneus ventricosus]
MLAGDASVIFQENVLLIRCSIPSLVSNILLSRSAAPPRKYYLSILSATIHLPTCLQLLTESISWNSQLRENDSVRGMVKSGRLSLGCISNHCACELVVNCRNWKDMKHI